MRIVLDTNILFDRWFLTGPQFALLRRHAATGQSIVFIPSVAVLELRNQYLKKVSEHFQAVQKLTQVLPPGYTLPPLPLPQHLAEDYPQYLRTRIAELGFKEVDYKDIPHDRIMEKATKRQKPFTEGGSDYQDCLLWEIILQNVVKVSDVTYFITRNHKDFAVADQQNLHSDLLEDMRARGIPETCVRYIPDLKTLIDSLITPDMPAVESDELSAFGNR